MTVAELVSALQKAKNQEAEVMVADEQGKLTLEIILVDESTVSPPRVTIVVEEWPTL